MRFNENEDLIKRNVNQELDDNEYDYEEEQRDYNLALTLTFIFFGILSFIKMF